jgi:hypothetical protein
MTVVGQVVDPQVIKSSGISIPVNPGGVTSTLTADRHGYWIFGVDAEATVASGTGDAYVYGETIVNSTTIGHNEQQVRGRTSPFPVRYGYVYAAVVPPGTTFRCNFGTYFVSVGTWIGNMYLWFVPTKAYPK